MAFTNYKTKIQPLCPVAIKVGQTEVHAPDHDDWGVVRCDQCTAEYAIGQNRIYGSHRKAKIAPKILTRFLKGIMSGNGRTRTATNCRAKRSTTHFFGHNLVSSKPVLVLPYPGEPPSKLFGYKGSVR